MTVTIDMIRHIQPEIETYARDYGLDFFPTVFELVDSDTMSQLAAYGGFPIRYPHWRFGMEYDQLSKSYRYGLSKIYEMVINTDPCYAYLMQNNELTDQKLVMAHVFAHCDFFKNNYYFSPTNRKMLDEMANHAIRVRRYMDKYGMEKVETFIDICLSLENLIDPFSMYIKRYKKAEEAIQEIPPQKVFKLKSKKYMERFINPPDFIKSQQEELAAEQENVPELKIPVEPVRDVLWFLMRYAPLENWQHDLLGIIRTEAYYFAPQAMTKIMNEGWATFWHSTIMTTRAIEPWELLEYARHHSGTIASHPGRLNPYRIGYLLYKDIEKRWNEGKFGLEYEKCTDYKTRQNWNTQAGKGQEKIFAVRKIYNDLTFIDEFLTEDFCREHRLFSFAWNKPKRRFEIESREFHVVKQRLLQSLTNAGQPIIRVVDANFKNRGELVLAHLFEGTELDNSYIEDTLQNLFIIWKRPVHIVTVLNEKEVRISFDGKEISRQ